MKNRNGLSILWILQIILCLSSVIIIQGCSRGTPAEQATSILEKSGVQGGLIVHLNCGDGTLTEALRATDSFMVQGLDASMDNVRQARKHIASKQEYGPISVDLLPGNYLPYKDNLVNMIVAEDLGNIPEDEAMRILAPNGVLMTRGILGWRATVKPEAGGTDEWNQYLYRSEGNPVSRDQTVGPIEAYQWIGSPRWGRHHDTTASMSALVSANGRIFYILDEGPTESIQLPSENYLVARDAYNGTILWKKPLPEWQEHLFTLKSGPAYLPRRLVAKEDRVYVTLGINAPLSELNAATGEVLRTFQNTEETSEVIFSDNTLFLVVGRPEKMEESYAPKETYVWSNADWARAEWAWDRNPGQVMAIDMSTGNKVWSIESPVAPLSLTADATSIYFYDGTNIVGTDRHTGEEKWRSDAIESKKIDTAYAPRIVVNEDVLLFSIGSRGFGSGTLVALSTVDGKKLWDAPQPGSGHYSPEDVFVINGLVWTGATANVQDSGNYTGRDLHTGEVVTEIKGKDDIYWFHQRCYISKATDNYIIPSRTGIEFVDLEEKSWDVNHYARGGCIYGVMPSNGLIYTPPHACACYMEAKLNGFCALGPASATETGMQAAASENRLQKGPAYNVEISGSVGAEDWPTYRHDTKRSSYTKTSVAPDVSQQWSLKLGGKLSSPVFAGDRIYISKVDAHTVYAIDAATGNILWDYAAGGRVDSPPTIYQGRVLFGSADGYVYCLSAADGNLIWRFRAAPVDLRMVAFEQVESIWPVHGSVLVQNDKVYCVAGRSVFLDGGMRMLQLDPKTGEKLAETILDNIDPETGKDLHEYVEGLNMPVGLSDILSSDGSYLYMRSQQFDLEGNRKHIDVRDVGDQTGEGAHVFSPIGFLDDTQFSRSYMMYGKSVTSGWGAWEVMGRLTPSGRLIAVDDDYVYGFARKPEFLSESTVLEFQLYAAAKSSREEDIKRVNQPMFPAAAKTAPKAKMAPKVMPAAKIMPKAKPGGMGGMPNNFMATGDWKLRQGIPLADQSALRFKWQVDKPDIQARAIVLANKTLFVAGPPDVVDEEEAFFAIKDEDIVAKLAEQSALLKGADGSRIWAVSAETGDRISEYKLDSLPVWDGMIAADGKLYLATMDGSVSCFAENVQLAGNNK
ncbi:MAG: PQQ-binding-like beta-propeller repeat protein [Acidobacteriota bacterium]